MIKNVSDGINKYNNYGNYNNSKAYGKGKADKTDVKIPPIFKFIAPLDFNRYILCYLTAAAKYDIIIM